MRTMSTPGTSSSASGFSLIDTQRSVPGMRPCRRRARQQPLRAHGGGKGARGRTRIVIRVRAERRTTSTSEMMMLTTMPISRSQTMERKKVVSMSPTSFFARSLWAARLSTDARGERVARNVLVVEDEVVRGLGEQAERNQAYSTEQSVIRGDHAVRDETEIRTRTQGHTSGGSRGTGGARRWPGG